MGDESLVGCSLEARQGEMSSSASPPPVATARPTKQNCPPKGHQSKMRRYLPVAFGKETPVGIGLAAAKRHKSLGVPRLISSVIPSVHCTIVNTE